jgi:ATP-binding cassette subfamily F protein 3
LSPPIVAMESASVGYDERVILSRLSLNISNDDRIGLLGSNGNGKSTFAKLVGGRLKTMSGSLRRSSKLEVGFFAQHQIDDLDPNGTPYSHVAPLMIDGTEAKIRSRVAQMGFPNVKADTRVTELSGGEKARLLMGLATFHGPHLLIMDEPTNHLDIDSRAALIEAINDYEGAVILVSHDRYLLEACADRLWLVSGGTVSAFDGDMDEYTKYVLEQAGAEREAKRRAEREERGLDAPKLEQRNPQEQRNAKREAKKKLDALEEKMGQYQKLMARIDEALAAPDAFTRDTAKATQLSAQRAELERALARVEEEWLELSEEGEAV